MNLLFFIKMICLTSILITLLVLSLILNILLGYISVNCINSSDNLIKGICKTWTKIIT